MIYDLTRKFNIHLFDSSLRSYPKVCVKLYNITVKEHKKKICPKRTDYIKLSDIICQIYEANKGRPALYLAVNPNSATCKTFFFSINCYLCQTLISKFKTFF